MATSGYLSLATNSSLHDARLIGGLFYSSEVEGLYWEVQNHDLKESATLVPEAKDRRVLIHLKFTRYTCLNKCPIELRALTWSVTQEAMPHRVGDLCLVVMTSPARSPIPRANTVISSGKGLTAESEVDGKG